MDVETRTDSDLVRLTATGDRQALADAFDRYAASVTRYAWALVPSRMDVEEVVQDTFVTLWQKARDITVADSSLLPWLLVVARNHAMNLRRKHARAQSDELPVDLAAPEEPEDARDRLRWVRDEIEALTPIDRQVCELCPVEGRPYAEAALLLGLSVGAVTQRVSRTRARLKKAVNDREH